MDKAVPRSAGLRDHRHRCRPLLAVEDPAKSVLINLNWDDVRLGLVRNNSGQARLWPRLEAGQPKPAEIAKLRAEATHTVWAAARAVCVSEQQWMGWEGGALLCAFDVRGP